jgi:hypothetical protein
MGVELFLFLWRWSVVVRPRWGRSGHGMPILTRFARSDTACRVPTFWVVVYDFLLSLIAKSPYIWGV